MEDGLPTPWNRRSWLYGAANRKNGTPDKSVITTILLTCVSLNLPRFAKLCILSRLCARQIRAWKDREVWKEQETDELGYKEKDIFSS